MPTECKVCRCGCVRRRRLARALIWVGLVVAPVPPLLAQESDPDPNNAVTLFGGWLTDNNWEEASSPGVVEFRDSWLLGLAASRRISQFGKGLSLELEGQVVRHFGDQTHWEFNLPIIARWETFPWDNVIETSLAWGIGPSYASEKPAEEVAREGDSQRWLVYWLAELELGLPGQRDWTALMRLHHRSEAFGLIADEGGSNVLAVGVRRRF